ncbi:solute carrier family 26 member 6-like [Protopterus annectens]|uniref:solute carrier family 26 member 6-like n=1 Tax=Protopterus annectens TaxID=7888 RepID=UPI001CFAD8C7|nr:solute carrier family 26 member 6-like [Protopterus annectens]
MLSHRLQLLKKYTGKSLTVLKAVNTPEAATVRSKVHLRKGFKSCYTPCSGRKAKGLLLKFFPVFYWLPRYPFRDLLLGDVISGISVGIIQLPQGLAYALLAAVPPVHGLYSAFIPVLMYFLLGTSRNISIGGFAVLSVMIGSVVEELAPDDQFIIMNDMTNLTEVDVELRDKMRVQVAATLAILTGIVQVLLGLIQFGFVVNYLSDPLVRGYTTAAALHVGLSQVKYILGVNISRYSGPASFIFTIIDLCINVPKTNIGAVIVSILSAVVIFGIKQINSFFSSKMPVPFPAELAVLIISTVISSQVNLNSKYNIEIVGTIPSGLKAPSFPSYGSIGPLVGRAFAVAIVGYGLAISLAKTFATKHGYHVDSNQELIALGMSNFVGGFFQCHAISTSMSRSLIQESCGGKSQVAGAVSTFVILIIILKIGELFQQLPKAVLAAVIIVNLLGMFKQFRDISILWRSSKLEMMVWLVAFFATVLLNMDIGLAASIGFVILTVIFRTQLPHYSVLGQLPNTDIYKDVEKYEEIEEIPGIKIIQSSATVYFANADLYSEAVKKKSGISVSKLIEAKKKAIAKRKKTLEHEREKAKKEEKKQQELKAKNGCSEQIISNDINGIAVSLNSVLELNANDEDKDDPEKLSLASLGIEKPHIHSVILEFSTLNYADTVCIKVLKNIFKDFHEIEVQVYLASCQSSVVEQMEKGGFFGKEITKSHLFTTIHDAVVHCSGINALESSTSTKL